MLWLDGRSSVLVSGSLSELSRRPWEGEILPGAFFISSKVAEGQTTGEQAMKQTDNLRAAAYTRATQIATSAAKEEIRSEGRKLLEYEASELRKRAAALIASDPTIIERAMVEIIEWRLAELLRKNRSANTAGTKGPIFPDQAKGDKQCV